MNIKKDNKMSDKGNKKKAVRLFTLRKWKGFAGDMKALRRATKEKTNIDAIIKAVEILTSN